MVNARQIAIVGMACRFPDSPDLSSFWSNILARRVSFRPIPARRWNHDLFYTKGRDSDRTNVSHGAFLDDIQAFGGDHFGIAPRRAEVMDPQQRILLELAYQALVDAGLDQRPWLKEKSAVYMGVSVDEYAYLVTFRERVRQMSVGQFGKAGNLEELLSLCEGVPTARNYTISGNLLSMCASLISQTFDVGGPSMTVDAACATSLVSVACGVDYLRTLPPKAEGPSPVALVGGAYLNLVPDNLIGFSRVGAMAKDSCRPFDKEASGFLIGEGAGVIVLKRLDDALADGDQVYAVIQGQGWTSDGLSPSPTTPEKAGQMRALRQALADARVEPVAVDYVECHGTGTLVGDQVELQALQEVLSCTNLPIGSIKANIGHTLAASGIAGLIKTVLALHHGVVPPQAGWEDWHPNLQPYSANFSISPEPRAWPKSERTALVSSFGFGGLNCCMVCSTPPSGAEQKIVASAAPLARKDYWFIQPPKKPRPLPVLRQTVLQCLSEVCQLHPQLLEPSLSLYGHLGLDDKALLDLCQRLKRRCCRCPEPEFWADATVARLLQWYARPTPWLEFELSLESHPFLHHHVIGGRPFLPLAVALDWMAWSENLTTPWALGQIEVNRALMIQGQGLLKGGIGVRLKSDQGLLELIEVRPGGRESIAFRARLDRPGPAPEHTPASGPPPAEGGLDEFYRSHTFHGPALRGLTRIDSLSPTSVVGQVRTSRPCEWVPSDPRQVWHLDPLVVDSAFQLALYAWQGPPMLPRAIGELAWLEPLRPGQVEVRIDREESALNIGFYQDQRLMGWMKGVEGQPCAPLTPHAPWRHLAPRRPISSDQSVERKFESYAGAALTLIPGLVGPGDLVCHPRSSSEILVQACLASQAARRAYSDPQELREILEVSRGSFRRLLLISQAQEPFIQLKVDFQAVLLDMNPTCRALAGADVALGELSQGGAWVAGPESLLGQFL